MACVRYSDDNHLAGYYQLFVCKCLPSSAVVLIGVIFTAMFVLRLAALYKGNTVALRVVYVTFLMSYAVAFILSAISSPGLLRK